jgi:hypothetical protein
MLNARSSLIATTVASLVSVSPAHAQAATPAEQHKIEALIGLVENLTNSSFVRNGKVYQPKDAAKFLRGKWSAKKAEIRTVNDFIDKVATVSGTTGQPYIVRFSDGKEMRLADYLRAAVPKIGG